jgi:DUF971 family protein
VTIEFEDGARCEFPLAELRRACPCAACRGLREAGRPAWDGDGPLSIVSAELVGAWGLSVEWHDGHSTGIYPWSSLRRWYDGETDGVNSP